VIDSDNSTESEVITCIGRLSFMRIHPLLLHPRL
jgi:hypothetical protein